MSKKEIQNQEEEAWELLGKSIPQKPSADFTDRVMSAAKDLPQTRSWSEKILSFSPWIAAAACLLTAALFTTLQVPTSPSLSSTQADHWEETELLLDEAYLLSAVDHLDTVSNDDLIALLGF